MSPAPDVKRCPCCGRLKPLRGFYRRPSGGPSGYCRLCQREVSRAARRRHMQDPAAVAKVRARDRARKSPGLVRFYLTGRLRHADTPASAGQVERLEREAARLRAALELLTACQHGQGLDCPNCEPVPDLVRQTLEREAVRPA